MNAFFINMAIGYTRYSDDGEFVSRTVTTGSALGAGIDLDYDIGLSEHTAFGICLSYKIATLTDVEVTANGVKEHIDLAEENYEGLARFEITIGLRLR
jgi:hypothetical protein